MNKQITQDDLKDNTFFKWLNQKILTKYVIK